MTIAAQLIAQSALAGMMSAAGVDTEPSTWAGHQVTLGTRWVPFKGTVRTRMDSFVLARGRWEEGRWVFTQKACAVQFAKVAGVRVKMEAEHLPRSTFSFDPRTHDDGFNGSSRVMWGEEDIDRDGHPGMTIEIDAPMCDGRMHVTNDSITRATGWFGPQAFAGKARVRVEQRVLGVEGACLSMVADDTEEQVEGPFAYVPVASKVTCADLLSKPWPVNALNWR